MNPIRLKTYGEPLRSIDGLKYLSIIWYIIGTNQPKDTLQKHWRIIYYIYSVAINLVCAVFFPATTLINLFFIDSYKDLVANLSLSLSIVNSTIKQFFVLKQRQLLLKSIGYLKMLDERNNYRDEDCKNIFTAIRFSQLYALYFPLYVFCGCGFGYNGWTHHRMIYNAWYPEIFSNPEYNYLMAFIFQFISQIYTGFQSVFNDIYPICYLTLMNGHLKSLAARITRIGWHATGILNSERQNIEELKNCIRDHQNLLSYFACIRPLISITLFCQFLIAGLALCLTAINLTFFSREFKEQFFALVYLTILLIQMFPCCWQVNVLMAETDYLTTAMYGCNWLDQNLKFRKILIIFMQRSQKTNTIIAGGLAPVTLQTFSAIIRFSFSMFTILSKK